MGREVARPDQNEASTSLVPRLERPPAIEGFMAEGLCGGTPVDAPGYPLGERGRLAETRLNLLPTVGPQSVSVVLTNACNLRCLTCWSYSPLKNALPMADWRRKRLDRVLLQPLFAELAALGTERVIFTGGGDPLAHPECLEVFGDARQAGLKVTLISNLTLVRSREAFLALKLTTILANFSCADPETYVAFHPGRTEADFHTLIALLREVVASGTQLKLVFVVCAVNCHVLGKALTLAKELGASVQFKLMSAIDETQSLVLSAAQRDALFAERAQLESLGASANLDTFYTELSGSAPDRFPIDEVGCYAGHWYARVDGDANVRFCCNPNSELTLGNLHETSFTELWRSQAWHALRTRLRSGDFLPGCERCGKFDLNVQTRRRLEQSQGAFR